MSRPYWICPTHGEMPDVSPTAMNPRCTAHIRCPENMCTDVDKHPCQKFLVPVPLVNEVDAEVTALFEAAIGAR